MSRSQFRLLLAAYLLLVAGDVLTDSVTKSMIPESVARAQSNSFDARFGPHGLSAITVAAGTGAVVIVFGMFVGFIGMFFFWRPGLYLFFAAVILRL